VGTLTLTTAGFAALPAQVPKYWPTNLVWPNGGNLNASKTYTISDSDMQQMMSWMATAYGSEMIAGVSPAPVPPVFFNAVQYFLYWFNGFMQATTDATQHQQTDPPVVPPPISIT